jgi:(2Fe-2S) ferredoxin
MMKGNPRKETSYAIFCCQGKDCIANGSKKVLKRLRTEVHEAGIKRRTHIVKTECNAQAQGVQQLVWYGKLKPKDAKRIVREHLIGGEIVEENCCS